MNEAPITERPLSRISVLLPKLKMLWHFYPELSFAELLNEIVFEANLVPSDLPVFPIEGIEDIAYPENHYLYDTRNLEMGIAVLLERHKNSALPPVPFQAATLRNFETYWRRHPNMRLGQILAIPSTLQSQ